MTRTKVSFIPLFVAAAVTVAPTVAQAGDGEAEASVEASTDEKAETAAVASNDPKRADVPWIKRWAPEPRTGEVGLFGGVALISSTHELYGVQLDRPFTDYGWKPIAGANADIGIRGGFYPIRHFGVEAEFAAIPLGVPSVGASAFGFSIRAQLVGQIGLWSVTPFATLGAGTLAISSADSILGNDQDEVLHIGLGAKAYLTRYVQLRFDFRNLFASERGPDSGGTSHQELLFGLSFTLGRGKNVGPSDSDGDGIDDDVDACPGEVGVAEYEGCPIPDTDGDGMTDDVDKCPNEAGAAEYEGCPIPDTDGDGFKDDVDKCPNEAGVEAYDGCPIPDTDGDGIKDDVDECKDEPETKNGYKDQDGCADEVPKEVARFTGVIKGIYFDTGKSSIKEGKSKESLIGAIDVLKKFPSLRVEISGHTDARGKEDENMTLSTARAAAVRTYLVVHGVPESSVETIGWGPFKPVESNDSRNGRAANRRIEFRLLQEGEHASTEAEINAEIAEIKASGGPKPPAKPTDKAVKVGG